MLGTLVKMHDVPEHLHARLDKAMDELDVKPYAREVAEIFMRRKTLDEVSDEAWHVYRHMIWWASKPRDEKELEEMDAVEQQNRLEFIRRIKKIETDGKPCVDFSNLGVNVRKLLDTYQVLSGLKDKEMKEKFSGVSYDTLKTEIIELVINT